MNRDSTCPVCYLLLRQYKRYSIYTRYKFGLFGNPKASDGTRTRDTNLEGWDVTTTPISQRVGDFSPGTSSHKRKYKTSLKSCQATDWIRTCDPTIILPNDSSRIRTYDRLLRRQLLYPTELLSQSDRFLSPPILNLSKGTAAEKRFVPLNVYSIEHYCGRVKPFC